MAYTLQTIPLDQVEFNPRQPRSDAEATDLASLAASLGDDPSSALFAQLAVVYPLPTGRYRVQSGERRIRAAQRRGFPAVQVLVLDQAVPISKRHHLSLLENLHRAELSVIDEAIGLKVAYFYANAIALNLTAEADVIMETADTSLAVMLALQALLDTHGWKRTTPQVSWETCLATLGLTMNKQALMRRLYVLNMDTSVIERILALSQSGTVDLTEASIRVIGKLEVADQNYLLDAISTTPDIANKIRRICGKVEDGTYTVQEAIAEARGEVYLGEDAGPAQGDRHRDQAPPAGREPERADAAGDRDADGGAGESRHPGSPDADRRDTAGTPPQTPPPPRAAVGGGISDDELEQSLALGDACMEVLSLLGQLEEAVDGLQTLTDHQPVGEPWAALLHDAVDAIAPLVQWLRGKEAP